jgi:hypothetical protein
MNSLGRQHEESRTTSAIIGSAIEKARQITACTACTVSSLGSEVMGHWRVVESVHSHVRVWPIFNIIYRLLICAFVFI